MKLDSLIFVRDGEPFGEKGSSHGGLVEFIKFITDETGEDTAFSDTAVSDCYQLDWVVTVDLF